MRILFVATLGETHRAFLRGQIQFLQQRGFEVHLVASPGLALSECGEWPGVRVWGVPMSRRTLGFKDIPAFFRLANLFHKIKPDVLHLSTPKAAFLGSVASVFLRKTRKIFFVRGSITGAQRGWSKKANRFAETLTAKLCDEAVVVSHSLLKFLRTQKILSKNQGTVVGHGMSNGIDIERFQPVQKDINQKKIVGPVIGFVGRLTREKGIETLFFTWQIIKQKFPEATLLLVGSWDDQAPVSTNIKKALIADARVDITGFQRDVVKFYKMMDVFVFLSWREGFPNAPMEASAMQIPVVGTCAVGTNDAIVDGVTGSLVQQSSPEQISDAIEAYIKDPKLASDHGFAGRRRVIEHFSQELVWNSIYSYYRTKNSNQKKTTCINDSIWKKIQSVLNASFVMTSSSVLMIKKLITQVGTLYRNFRPHGHSWPYFDKEQRIAVEKILQSGKVNYWTGEHGRLFESEYAKMVGRKHGIAVANGTVAIELALESLDIGPGDDVIVPSRTFVGTASAVVTRGARPVFTDINFLTQNTTAEYIKNALTPNTKAVILVHVGGTPCDMNRIMELAEKNKIHVIEDCAQAHGATYNQKQVGSFGVISTFSFCQDKIISTGGEGGMVLMDDDRLWKRAWSYKDHGKNFDVIKESSNTGSFRYLHEFKGTNWRLTEVQSAIGRIQLRRLAGWVKERQGNAAYLRKRLLTCPGLIFNEPDVRIQSSFYRLYVLIDQSRLNPGWTRDRIISEVNKQGFKLGCGSCGEIYLEKSLKKYRPRNRFANARLAQDSSLAFLVHPGLSHDNLNDISDAVIAVMKNAVMPSNRISSARAA